MSCIDLQYSGLLVLSDSVAKHWSASSTEARELQSIVAVLESVLAVVIAFSIVCFVVFVVVLQSSGQLYWSSPCSHFPFPQQGIMGLCWQIPLMHLSIVHLL